MVTATNMEKMFHTRNELSEEVRGQMIPLLNQQLADTVDLYSQAKHAHWNVK
jgi:starvation-inducible DNA-binding protein